MKTQKACFDPQSSKTDNDCLLRPGQKYPPLWRIHSRCCKHFKNDTQTINSKP